MGRITSSRSLTAGALVAAAMLVATLSATAQDPEERGAELLSAVESGQMDCADLDTLAYEAIGEFVMGRMLGSPRAHETMDELMAQMMGDAGLDRMHQVMGQRLAGCGQPGLPAGLGMMGMMGMMGGGAGGYGPGGFMGPGGGSGAAPDGGYGPGGMMGFDRGVDDDDDDDGVWMGAAMLILVLVAGGVVFLLVRSGRGRGGAGPSDLLAQRFARGDIDVEDYERRRRLLEGGS